MAHHYYVNDNAQPNGDHEVHKDGCNWLLRARSKTYLGYFDRCDHGGGGAADLSPVQWLRLLHAGVPHAVAVKVQFAGQVGHCHAMLPGGGVMRKRYWVRYWVLPHPPLSPRT